MLLLPPWTRAPGLVWRTPMVVLAVLAAAAILTCTAGSAALFLSSAGSASVQRQLAAPCPDGGYPTIAAAMPAASRPAADRELRARTAAEGLAARRMGLTTGAHLRSMLAELGLLAGTAVALGAGLGLLAVALVYGRLDVRPEWPPPPLFTWPLAALLGTVAAGAVVAAASAFYAHHAATRTNPAEILRLES